MVIKLGINGFGRIGRVVFRTCLENDDIEITAINDPAITVDYISYLIKFDSTHGKFNGTVTHTDHHVKVNGRTIQIFHEKLPSSIPWDVADTRYVVEASGMFTTLDKASGHLTSEGVLRVLVTAPSVDIPMFILGVNDQRLNSEPWKKVISCTSSTLYCLAPIVKLLEDNYGVTEGFVTSIHAMTPSLKPLDGLCIRGKHWRDHRSIHQNIIPANTGACRALVKIIPQTKDKLIGIAFRVPIVNVSVLDLTVRLAKNTSLQDILRKVDEAGSDKMRNIIKTSNEGAVSSDFFGDSHSCVIDVESCLQLRPNSYKLICWYENEYSYACRIVETVRYSDNPFSKYRYVSKMTFVRPMPMKKEDYSQQTEHFSKENSTNMEYSLTNYSKSSKLSVSNNKKYEVRNDGQTKNLNRNDRTKNEMFMIWKDDAESPVRQYRSSFFQNSLTIQGDSETFDKKASKTKIEINKSPASRASSPKRRVSNESGKIFSQTSSKSLPRSPNKSSLRIFDIQNNMKSGEGDSRSTDNKNSSDEKNDIKDESDYLSNDENFESYIQVGYESTRSNGSEENSVSTKKFVNSKLMQALIEGGNFTGTCKYNFETSDNIERDACLKTDSPPIENNSIEDISDIERCNSVIQINQNDKDNELSNQVEVTDLVYKPDVTKANIVETCTHNDKTDKTFKNINADPNEDVTAIDTKVEKTKAVYITLEPKNLVGPAKSNHSHITCFPSTSIQLKKSQLVARFNKSEIYDKLHCDSATNSEFSLVDNKSQVLSIRDLTNSLEDLENLDKICKIMEISDELSDKLFSSLKRDSKDLLKKWSFKDLCEKIKLNEFCNNVLCEVDFDD